VQLGEPPPDGPETLARLVDRSQHLAEHVQAISDKRAELERDIQKLDHRLAKAREESDQGEAERTQWRNDWARAIEPLGLDPQATPAVVNEFLARLGDLFGRLKEAQAYAERIKMIGLDAQAFAGQVKELARQVDLPLADRPPEEAAEELIDRLARAKSDRQKQTALLDERARRQTELDEAGRQIEELSAKLSTMCEEAGCRAPDDLPKVEEASRTAAGLRQNLRELDDQLLALSPGAGIEALVVEVEAADADNLPAAEQSLTEEIKQLESERGELRERIGSERKELEKMDAGTEAADAAEEAQHLVVQIEAEVRQYVRLRLASAVLREAIEKYQKEHEAPVLRRASELFCRLTAGSFQQLLADFDPRGEKVLMGDRGDRSQPVALAGMSDGTCDQLYLALRLASLENYLADREPIPFIVDDILISFDNQRAAAALKTLAELSRRTQVIFFTHHEHLVRLATGGLDEDTLFVHELAGEPAFES
jgi:uncharacterized protein YhaN